MIPEEHDLTFSWLNTSVIQVGVMFLLVTDATGPVYGWAQYIFSAESGLCILDPGSRYVTTYISVSLPLYYFLPLLVTVCSHTLILLQKNVYHEEDEYPFPSRIIPSGRRGQVLLCLSCVLPFLGRLPSVLALVICSSKLNSYDPMKLEQDTDDIDVICREGKLDFFLVKHVKICFTTIFLALCKWRRASETFESPMELSIRGKFHQSNQCTIQNQSPDEETVEIV
ncbi:hypothetical protein L9F63_025454 [Diploptera punctata]|uniref:Uncharacterized protein n=1 Tax=Diploptera punctata TaxID=6984 RepID=A0AAD7Z9L1_DIPPU|nr:hypothetical protein L9F63_025454 [Diploptera punctata]